MPLVLQRKTGEVVVIGGAITVTVIGAENGKARLLIDAPKDVRVDRLEIAEERAEYAAKDGRAAK